MINSQAPYKQLYQGMIIKTFADTDIDAYRRAIKYCGFSSSVHDGYIKVGKPYVASAVNGNKLGKVLKKVRTYKRIDKRTLAEQIGVHEDTIYKWESGMRKPTDENLVKVCDILGIDVEELIDTVSKGRC